MVQVLIKIICAYSSIFEEKPMLEDEIGRLICGELFKAKKSFSDLGVSILNDEDHSDYSRVGDILLKIIRTGTEFNEDYPDN